ncbi:MULTISPECIES: FAD-dependent oxidoreductase [unclassified Variovorax]|jgi:glycine/D-amino acid oxidase-like deaminating enzyme|uniref:NAD(P)/FAD-dependent oxidoreductase n=1 Tax=unclassified Variovorax TaxID=663243 RepID=UPI000F7E3C9B|nr:MULTISPECIES: FAD-dependent oxidoreductase [unclassified Variovorax]RSZ38301.1 FAD-binding oxidoreductase [Variovorax sp. 553]RSZ39246.1 FAD-binding oxidoreductase [Variovorax sp. 679]
MDADVIVIGAGIVGAACAHALARAGAKVLVLDAGIGGATGAGMGHLVVMDDNAAELELSRRSIAQWRELAPCMSEDCAYSACGTLWIAANDEEMAEAGRKQQRLREHGIESRLLDARELARAEPALRKGLAGALEVPGDGILYAPNAARWLLAQAADSIRVEHAKVDAIEDDGTLRLADGTRRTAPQIVLANGIQATALCPELPIRPKKGHLLITDRYPGTVHHQLVELGYVTSAHHSDGDSVAFNVQPRPTGQLLVGSSRQFDTTDPAVEAPMLARMLQRTLDYLPGLANLNALRSWTGMRAASPDGLPLLGKHPWREKLWLAVGHEGLGVTTAPGSAHLLAALMTGATPDFDAAPYAPRGLRELT